jgi:hypothetical protein
MSTTPANSLPTQHDFDPWKGNLDAHSAWEHFGGLTLVEAQSRFQENPIYYQEDFMFMGPKAFAYYYPVIDSYLRNVPDADNFDDHESWILAQCVRSQFEGNDLAPIRHLAPRVLDLADFIRTNIRRFGGDDSERQRVGDAWADVAEYVSATTG